MSNFKTWLKFRIFIVLLLFFAAFMIVFIRAFQLQVVEREKLKTLASRQSLKEVTFIPKRGTIYDRNMKELAVSTDAVSVYAVPSQIENTKEVIKTLAPIVTMDKRELRQKITKDKPFVWIKRKVAREEADRLKGLKLEGIGVLTENKRFYPNLQLASHVVGFSGLDSNGLEGVELKFDDYLKGAAKRFIDERDAHGEAITINNNNIDRDATSRGMDVVLTIDKTIQYITEKELEKAVESTNAKGGMAIVMNPHTGEILAMADSPSFNPNIFWKYSPHFWRNSMIADVFEPGSTFKTFLISAAFEDGIAKPSDSFFCENGAYKVADRTIREAHDGRFGWLSVTDIIKHSSNIGSSKIGEKLGKEKFYRYMKEFGFGSKTDIDMPGETTGNVPHPKKWSRVSVDTMSYGQGVSVTAIQIITAFSAVANNGYLMKPIVVKKIIDRDGAVVREFNPEVKRRVISEKTAKKVADVLKEVTRDGGTGAKAQVEGFEVAGKTGTAQKPNLSTGGYSDGKYMSSFIGFIPADNPKIAVFVLLDEPKGVFYGGQVAAPVFREIAAQTLPYLGVYIKGKEGVMPTLPPVATANQETQDIDEADNSADILSDYNEEDGYIMPDLRGKTIRHVLKIAREIPLEIKVLGSGKAFFQRPVSGAKVAPGAVCEVRFQ